MTRFMLLIICFFSVYAMADNTKQSAADGKTTNPTTAQKHRARQPEPDIQTQDPNADRIGFFSTAEVLPKGNKSFNNYDIGIVQISWGVAKNLELSFTSTIPLYQGALFVSTKYQIASTKRVRFAMKAYGGFFETFAFGEEDFITRFLLSGGGASGILDVCVGHSCNSLISFGARFAAGIRRLKKKPTKTLLGYQADVNGIFKVSKRVKILAGLSFDHIFSREPGTKFSGVGACMLVYGVRIYGSRFAGDIGLVRPLFTLNGSTVYNVEDIMVFMPLGYPFVNFTYKW